MVDLWPGMEIGGEAVVAGCCGEERLLLWCSLEAGVELLLLWCSLGADVDGERAGSVGRSCRCWRSAAGRFVREELEKKGSAGCCRMKKAPLRLEKGAAEREDLWKGELIRGCCWSMAG